MLGVTTVVNVYSDGACSGNPGPGAIGILLLDQNNQELERHKECIGQTTNNRAEYHALIKGLDLAAKYCRKTVYCFLDSDLVVKQLNGDYRLRNDELRKLFHSVKEMERPFQRVIYNHVHRSNHYIRRADNLTRQALSGTV
jgi:ribonuclease HI